MQRVLLGLVALALCAPACSKQATTADRSTPEATVRSFFAALDAGRIPAELESFVIDERERAGWKLRCELDGCASGHLERLQPVEALAWRAVLRLTYDVRSRDGIVIMSGRDAPVTLERDGAVWKIREFGPVTRLRIGPRDAGTATDNHAGPSDGAAPRDSAPAPTTAPTPAARD